MQSIGYGSHNRVRMKAYGRTFVRPEAAAGNAAIHPSIPNHLFGERAYELKPRSKIEERTIRPRTANGERSHLIF